MFVFYYIFLCAGQVPTVRGWQRWAYRLGRENCAVGALQGLLRHKKKANTALETARAIATIINPVVSPETKELNKRKDVAMADLVVSKAKKAKMEESATASAFNAAKMKELEALEFQIAKKKVELGDDCLGTPNTKSRKQARLDMYEKRAATLTAEFVSR